MNAVTAEAALRLADERPLVTPEGVALRLSLAPVTERLAALLLDLVIMAALLIGLSVAIIFGLIGLHDRAMASVLSAIWLLGFFLLRNFYFIHFEAGPRAATPGKRALGLRVAARDGGRLGVDAVFGRNLMRELEFYLPISLLAATGVSGDVDAWTALAGLVWTLAFVALPFVNRDRLRLGDLVAGTWVVRAPRPALGLDLGGVEASTGNFTEAELNAYGELELTTLEAVLRSGQAAQITVVATAIRARIGRPAAEADEAFLRRYYAALRTHLERNLLFGRRRADKNERLR